MDTQKICLEFKNRGYCSKGKHCPYHHLRTKLNQSSMPIQINFPFNNLITYKNKTPSKQPVEQNFYLGSSPEDSTQTTWGNQKNYVELEKSWKYPNPQDCHYSKAFSPENGNFFFFNYEIPPPPPLIKINPQT